MTRPAPPSPRPPDHAGARRLLKNVFFVVVARGTALLSGLAVYIIAWQYLRDTSAMADFVLVRNTALILLVLADFGMGDILTREAARRPEDSSALLGSALATRALVGLLCVVGVAGVSLAQPWRWEIRLALWVAGTATVVDTLSDTYVAMFRSRERMEFDLVAVFTNRVVTLAGTVAAWLFDLGFVAMFAASLLGALSKSVLIVALGAWKFFRFRLHVAPRTCGYLLSQAWPIGAVAFLHQFLTRMPQYVLAFMAKEDFIQKKSVALFDAANSPFMYILLLPAAVGMALFPMLSRKAAGSMRDMGRAVAVARKLLLVLSLPAFAALAAMPREIVGFISRGRALDAVPLYMVLVWALPLTFLLPLTQTALISMGRQLGMLCIMAGSIALNVGLNVLMIRSSGLIGAAYGTLASTLAYVVALNLLLHVRVPFGRFPWRLLPALAGAAAMYGLTLLAGAFLGKLALLLAGGAVYLAFVLLLGVFDAEEKQMIAAALRRRPKGPPAASPGETPVTAERA